MCITQITQNKKQYLSLLLLADEQEDMIDRYLEKGTMFVLDDDGVKAECVVTDEGNGVLEIKNIATDPESQGKGYGKKLLDFVAQTYCDRFSVLQVGTGDSPLTIPFYEKCGFKRHHIVKDFFTTNYDHPIFEAGVQLVDMIYLQKPLAVKKQIGEFTLLHNELSAEQFIELWQSVGWGEDPSLEQTRLAMEHTLFRVSVFHKDKIIAMARLIGDMGLDYYIKDVIVRPEYQKKGIGSLLINELLQFINDNGISGTDIFVELCAMPDKIPFYQKFGFDSNEAQRLKMMHTVKNPSIALSGEPQ